RPLRRRLTAPCPHIRSGSPTPSTPPCAAAPGRENLLRRAPLGVGRPQSAPFARGHGPPTGALRLPRLAGRFGSGLAAPRQAPHQPETTRGVPSGRASGPVLRLLLFVGHLPRDGGPGETLRCADCQLLVQQRPSVRPRPRH